MFVVSAIAISMHSTVFIIGGVASVFYLNEPAIGIALVVAGVLLGYQLKRHSDRKQEELFGAIILKIQNGGCPYEEHRSDRRD